MTKKSKLKRLTKVTVEFVVVHKSRSLSSFITGATDAWSLTHSNIFSNFLHFREMNVKWNIDFTYYSINSLLWRRKLARQCRIFLAKLFCRFVAASRSRGIPSRETVSRLIPPSRNPLLQDLLKPKDTLKVSSRGRGTARTELS
jgi:hypothetical protein